MKTKSTLQTPRTLARKAILLGITALVVSAWPTVALAADCPNKSLTVWTGAVDNNWFNGGNWTNGMPICNGEVSYDAKINNGGTAQINYPNASACEVTLGVNATDSGTVFVNGNGSNLTTCSGTLVGYQGKGNLSITNGGVVTTGIDAAIAWGTTSNTSSSGAVTVDGTNSKWTVDGELDIGGTTNLAGGTGLLSVTNSATVTAGSVHVWKSGTLTGNGTVSVGSGSGTVTVDGTVSRSSGTLTITGNLGLNGTATTQYSVTPQDPFNQADVSVSGTASLNGRLSVTMTGTFTPGTQFTLLYAAGGINPNHPKFSSVSITFPTGQNFTPEVTYPDTNHVYLYLASNTGP